MKGDLITLHAVRNYGSVLQAYATQETFKKLGVDLTCEPVSKKQKSLIG